MLARLTPLTIALCFLAAPLLAQKVDESPAPAKVVRAFPKLRLTRPPCLRRPGTARNRLFTVTQQGKINFFPKRPERRRGEGVP